MQDDAVLLNHYWGDPGRLYARAGQLHATWVRVMVKWAGTMPGREARARRRPRHVHTSFAAYDRLIATARAHHRHVQLVLGGPSPAWASGNRRVAVTGSFEPSAAAYGRWAGTAARHFRREGITRYSIWNEPNHYGYLRPRGRTTVARQGALYRGLYRAGSAAIRRVQPRAQILFGELASYGKRGQSMSPLSFLRGVLCVDRRYRVRSRRCPRLVADGVAQHPYDDPGVRRGPDDVTMNSLGHLSSALDRFARLGALRRRGGGPMPIFLTEFAYRTRTPNHARGAILSEDARARFAVDVYATALRNRRVSELVWYQMYAPPAGVGQGWLSYLLHLDDHPLRTFTSLAGWARRHARSLAR